MGLWGALMGGDRAAGDLFVIYFLLEAGQVVTGLGDSGSLKNFPWDVDSVVPEKTAVPYRGGWQCRIGKCACGAWAFVAPGM
jgi:hypothetical protein